jgi:ATPase subunit of ABC transporter with duplicated ATPase domains
MNESPISAANNPFRSQCVIALPFRAQGASWEELLQNLESMNWRGAVIGPGGTGKTTLLEKLEIELENRSFEVHFFRLSTSHRDLPPGFWESEFDSHHAVLLDGAEQMPFWVWQRFKSKTKSAGALIITSHRWGRLPTWIRSSTSPALLAQLCSELGFTPKSTETERVFHFHGGNIRLCLMEFYDLAAKSP